MNDINPKFEFIADHLAENGYAVCDDFLNSTEIEAILALKILKADIHSLKRAGIGKESRQVVNEIRGDYVEWIDKQNAAEPIKVYLGLLQSLMQFLNQALFLSMKDLEIHVARYPEGAFYKRHLDQFKKDDHRKLSVICYLNKDWTSADGGQLRIYKNDGHLDVLPEAGRLVCFRSDLLEHEVLPAQRERNAITGWMLDQIGDLRHLS